MLDVLHFMFEEDNYFTSVEAVESRDNVRIHFYKNFYGVDYAYAMDKTASGVTTNASGVLDDPITDENIVPVDPIQRSKEVKPYIPVTQMNAALEQPFGSVLDAPLG